VIFRKTYMDKIIPFIDTPFVKVLTGVRRCGKSTVMEMIKEELENRGILKEQIISYRFVSLEYEDLNTAGKLYKEVKQRLYPDGRSYIFLDEVQEVEEWEKAVNSFISDFNADECMLPISFYVVIIKNYNPWDQVGRKINNMSN